MFLLKFLRFGGRSGCRFDPTADDVEAGCSRPDDGRCLPEKVKEMTSHDCSCINIEKDENDWSPVPVIGRQTTCTCHFIDEVCCSDLGSGQTFAHSDVQGPNRCRCVSMLMLLLFMMGLWWSRRRRRSTIGSLCPTDPLDRRPTTCHYIDEVFSIS